MASTTTVSTIKNIPVPKKRSQGLTITNLALWNSKTLLGAGIFYAMFIALVVGLLYPTLSSLNFNSYLTSNVVAGLVGVKLKNASTFSALMSIELYGSFYGLIFGGILAYIGGSLLPATAENGTLDLALARPVRRTRYYLEMWFSTLIGSVIVSALTVVAIWLSTLFVKNANVDWNWLIIAQSIALAFLWFSASVGMLFGSFLNGSRAAGGAAVGIVFLGYLMNTLGGLSDKLNWMLKAEPYYYMQSAQAFAEHDFTRWYPWVLVVAGLVCGMLGLVIFNRRDLPTT